MNNEFLKDLENFIINFKDSNFGDLESLNKYNFEILEFKNWYNNFKKKNKRFYQWKKQVIRIFILC